MLVPLELSILSQKKGYLSPELSIGWRVGAYAREFFGDPRETMIAAKENSDAVLALKWFTGRSGWGDHVTIAGQERPWDFLIYHPSTGTLLQMVRCRQFTELPSFMKSLEDHLNSSCSSLIAEYKKAMDHLILTILGNPIENIFLIIEHRCRRISVSKNIKVNRRCNGCGRPLSKDEIWEIDGEFSCLNCSVLEPSWFVYH